MGGFRPNRRSRVRASGVNHRRGELLRALLRRQHSVVTHAQLLGLGFTARQMERRLESGRLARLHRGVYLVGAVAPPLAPAMAVVLACGDRAFLSHRSAGHLQSITPYLPNPRTPHVTVVERD